MTTIDKTKTDFYIYLRDAKNGRRILVKKNLSFDAATKLQLAMNAEGKYPYMNQQSLRPFTVNLY